MTAQPCSFDASLSLDGNRARSNRSLAKPLAFAAAVALLAGLALKFVPPVDTAVLDHTRLQALEAQAKLDDSHAQTQLGLAYRDGADGLARDSQQARYWLERAAKLGEPSAARALGDLYAQGAGVPRDLNMADHWWRQAARGGNLAAEREHADALATHAAAADHYRGDAWLARAAADGDASARQELRADGAAVN